MAKAGLNSVSLSAQDLNSASKLDRLRELKETAFKIEFDKEIWNAPGLSFGVPRGIVVELLGNAKTEWLLSLFALHKEHLIFWCEGKTQINPTAIQQRGISLDRIKFIHCEEGLQQPLRMALESQFYPFIVAPNTFKEIKIFQRFQLLAARSKSTLFLLADKKLSQAWPISLQININDGSDGFELEVVRQKYGFKP